MRQILFAGALCALALPGAAVEIKQAPTTGRPVQFVDKSFVSFPQAVGDYALYRVDYDPKDVPTGASAAYRLPGTPATISVYVYPQGAEQEADVVDAQIAGVESVIREEKEYTDVVAGARTNFVVDAPKPMLVEERKAQMIVSAPEKITPEQARQRLEGAPSVAEGLKKSHAPTQSNGRRQRYELAIAGVPAHSAAFVFYRHLFNIKLRISAPAAGMQQADFDTFVDATARALVPKVDIRNFGQCGEPHMPLVQSGDDESDGHLGALAWADAMAKLNYYNCSPSEGDRPEPQLKGYERVEIVYPAGIWGKKE